MLRNGRINKVARLRRFRRSTTTPFLCARRPNLASPPSSKAMPARPMGRSGGARGGCRTPSHLLAVKQAFPPQEPRWHRWHSRLTLSLVERGNETYIRQRQCARSQSEAAPSPGGRTHHKELARTPARRRLADAGARPGASGSRGLGEQTKGHRITLELLKQAGRPRCRWRSLP
jgi:hypothetical protein